MALVSSAFLYFSMKAVDIVSVLELAIAVGIEPPGLLLTTDKNLIFLSPSGSTKVYVL